MQVRGVVCVTIAVVATVAPAAAQVPRDRDAAGDDSVDTAVARALIARGNALFRTGDYANARVMFIEALERDPTGPHAGAALEMLRRANAKLGRYRDDGVPTGASGQVPTGSGPQPAPGDGDAPLDPYAGGGDGGDAPLDPYAGGGDGGGDAPLDPYAGGARPDGTAAADEVGGTRSRVRRELMLWSAAYGFAAGRAIADPASDAAPAGSLLGLGAAVGASYWATRRWSIGEADAQAIESAGTWAAVEAAFLTHAIGGVDHDYTQTDGFVSVAIGGAVGVGAGVAWAVRGEPRGDRIALANSLGLYGLAGGLMFGVALDPPEPEAYSVNAVVGSVAGLAVGWWLADRVDTSRGRQLKVDIGAAVGLAAPWALVYPLVKDDGTNDDEQAVGALSMATMAAGGYLAWRFTRPTASEPTAPAPVPAVARRGVDGRWSLGVPVPRPFEDPRLAPPAAAWSVGIDLVGGVL